MQTQRLLRNEASTTTNNNNNNNNNDRKNNNILHGKTKQRKKRSFLLSYLNFQRLFMVITAFMFWERYHAFHSLWEEQQQHYKVVNKYKNKNPDDKWYELQMTDEIKAFKKTLQRNKKTKKIYNDDDNYEGDDDGNGDDDDIDNYNNFNHNNNDNDKDKDNDNDEQESANSKTFKNTSTFGITLKHTDSILDTTSWDQSPIVMEEFKIVIFTTPKVASTLIKKLLRRMSGFSDWDTLSPHDPQTNGLTYLWHYTLQDAQEIMSSPQWKRAIFLRDPKQRLISTYKDKVVQSDHVIKQCCKGMARAQLHDTGAKACKDLINIFQDESNLKMLRKQIQTLEAQDNNPTRIALLKQQEQNQIKKIKKNNIDSFNEFVLHIMPQCNDPYWAPQSQRLGKNHANDDQLWSLINFFGTVDTLQSDLQRLFGKYWNPNYNDMFNAPTRTVKTTMAKNYDYESILQQHAAASNFLSEFYKLDYEHPKLSSLLGGSIIPGTKQKMTVGGNLSKQMTDKQKQRLKFDKKEHSKKTLGAHFKEQLKNRATINNISQNKNIIRKVYHQYDDGHMLEGLERVEDESDENNDRTVHRRDTIMNQRAWDQSPIVMEDYKVIIFTTPKIGCTFIKKFLRRLRGYPDWNEEQHGEPPFLPHNPKSNGLTYLWQYPIEKANAIMTAPDWTRAIFVRDPKERLMSAYFDKVINSDYVERKCCFGDNHIAFDEKGMEACIKMRDVKKDIRIYEQQHQQQLFQQYKRQRQQQLRQSGGQPPDGNIHNFKELDALQELKMSLFQTFAVTFVPTCYDPHWAPQSDRMGKNKNLWSFINFVGTLETLEVDLQKLFSDGWDPKYNDMFSRKQQQQQQNNDAKKKRIIKKSKYDEYFQKNALIAEFVNMYYKDDYEHPLLSANFHKGE